MTQSSALAQRAALNQLFRNRNLTCMLADTRGFVWLCTSGGLVRFDGHSEVTFGERDGLAATPPNVVFEDSGGGLWVGSSSDLFQLNTSASGNRRQAFSRVVRPGGGPIGPVYGFSNSRDGGIWCASGTGLWRVTRREGKTVVSEVDIGLPDSANERVIRAVLEDPQRTLWAGSSRGLYRRGSDGRVTRLSTRDGFPSDEITVLAWADGYLWAGTGNGVARLRTDARVGPDRIRTFTAVDGLPAAPVTALSVERDGVRVSTSGGTAGIFPAASSSPQVVASNRVVSDGIASTRDAAGNFWSANAAGAFRILGWMFGPIAQFRGQGLLSLLRVDQGVCGLPSEPRSPAVCERPVSLLSIEPATADRPSGIYPYYALNAPSTGWSPLTTTDSRGRWFIPTPQGIAQFASRAAVEQSVVAKMWTASAGLPAGDVTALYGDSEGGLWVGIATSDESHIVRIDADTGRARVFGAREGYSPRFTPARSMTDDRRGTLWVGLDGGRLVRFQGGRFSEFVSAPSSAGGAAGNHPGALAKGFVSALLVDSRGRLWIGTSTAGLGRVDAPNVRNPQIIWYGATDGLGSDRVTALLEDDAQAVLVGTDRDLARIRPDAGTFTHHTLTDGKPGDAIVAAARDAAGTLWLATVGHEVLRRPPGRADPKPTFVLSVRVDQAPQWVPANGASDVRSITVSGGARTLEISWSSPEADLLDPVHYEQQLVLRDDAPGRVGVGWLSPPDPRGTSNPATVATGHPVPSADRRRTISLADATPGTYEFAVRTVSPDGNVGDEARVEFIVLAPVWQRWGFLAPLGLAFALIFYWVRTRQLAGVVRLRSRIASDLHDTVGARLSRITILSDVVRQQAPDQPPEVISALAAIGDNARAVVDDMSDAVWFINPACDDIHQLVVRVRTVAAAIFEQTPIAWSVNVQPDAIARKITADQRRHIYLVVKESLTNVLRHAGASTVSVNVELQSGRLRVVIDDDGTGQAVAEDGEMTRLGGNGIANMRRRAEELGGTLTIDLTQGNAGTHVVLDVPLGGRR